MSNLQPDGFGTQNQGQPASGNNPALDPLTTPLSSFSLPQGPQITFALEHYDQHRLPDIQTAQALVDLFHATYGAGLYPSSEFANAGSLLGKIAGGGFYSIVARDSNGNVAGHAAIVSVGDKSAELGRLFVDPAVRTHSLGKTLVNAQIQRSLELHGEGVLDYIYADAVTAHRASQRLYSVQGLEITGIFDRKYTDFFGIGNREGIARFSMILNPDIQKMRDVFLPSAFRDIALLIYSGLKCERTLNFIPDPSARESGTGFSKDTSELQGYGVTMIAPESERPVPEIIKDVEEAFREGAEYVEVKIDIGYPGAILQIESLQACGFFFSGLDSRPSGEYLTMQKLPDPEAPPYFPYIPTVYPKNAEDLLGLIKQSCGVQ